MLTAEEQFTRRSRNRVKQTFVLLTLAALTLGAPRPAAADVVTDWNQIAQNAIKTAGTSPAASPRVLAIVQAAVFDAVNGIERRYTPYHVDFDAPRGASRRAAAIQAAYATLVKLFPSQQAALDAQRAASLAAITDADDETGDNQSDGEFEDSQAITRGIAWGQRIADDILAWRSTDGFNVVLPPFTGGTAVGQWRPTPPAFAPANLPQMATMTPFALLLPSQFRPAGPPALTSDQYTSDFNEVKALGRATGSTRTDEQTEIARFWADNAAVHWNRIALSVAAGRHMKLSQNARLFALLNIGMADASLAAWDAKFTYVFWRPVTAIRLAATDGNDATTPDAVWTPLLATPAHPEYVSNHAVVSGAAAGVLASFFGDDNTFTHATDNLPGILRTHTSFSAAANEANDSRVFAGLHFRSACNDGRTMGESIAGYLTANIARPVHGKHWGRGRHDHPHGEIGADGEIADDDNH